MTGPNDVSGRIGESDDGWDDDRLDAAYRAAFEVETPTGLEHRIAARLAEEPARRLVAFPRFAPAAVSLVVLIAIAASTVSLGVLSPHPTVGPASNLPASALVPTPTTGAPTRPVSSLPWPFPDHVTTSSGSLVPISVAAAAQVRAAVPTPTEIAVAGWESSATDIRFCTISLPGLLGQLENQCVYNRWLAESPEPTSNWYDPPLEPAVRIVGDVIEPGRPVRRVGGPDVIHFRGGAVAVVVVGHFHDPTSTQCGAELAVRCSNTFVVDQLPWVLSTAGHEVVANPDVVPMSVAEAIEIRDSGSSSEIAVGGWFFIALVPCPVIPDAHPPLEACIANFTWLMRDPEQLATLASDGSGSVHAPAGPAISLVFDQATVPPHGTAPEPMMLVGHFNDSRASQCPAGDRRTACAHRFVIDEFLVVGDQDLAAPTP